VRLTVNGTIVETKKMRVGADDGALTGEYFEDSDFAMSRLTRDEPLLDFDWGASAPFSARWRGTLRPRYSERYRFTVDTTAAVRLLLDGEVIVPDEARSGELELEAGSEYELIVELRHRDGDASLRVTWESDSQASQLVPRSAPRVEPVTTKRRSVRR
jgi:hypothetical protein